MMSGLTTIFKPDGDFDTKFLFLNAVIYAQKNYKKAWCSGHCLSQRDSLSWVRVLPGCKDFMIFYISMQFFVT
jgi:hypothetical protein